MVCISLLESAKNRPPPEIGYIRAPCLPTLVEGDRRHEEATVAAGRSEWRSSPINIRGIAGNAPGYLSNSLLRI